MNRKSLTKKSIKLSFTAVFIALFSMFCGNVPVAATDAPYDIGAFYFSNWNPDLSPHMVVNTKNTYGRDNDWFGGIRDTLLKPGPWAYGPIADREPMLGWYDDRQQTVLDNHILQASSRGISHFAFYYYWKEDGTKPRLGQNVDLWKTSPNKDLMDYYLYFVADGAYNSTDWRANIVPKLIEFMKEPQYKRSKSTDPSMNDRPIIGFFGNMIARLGGTNETLKVELDYLRSESIKEGVGDPILLCNGYRTLSNSMLQGYDGFQPLNLAGIDLDKHPGIAEDYASSYPSAWNEFVYKDYSTGTTGYENYENYLFIPGGLNAFDARPWRGVASDSEGDYVYTDPSPNKFKVQLNNVKNYLDTHKRSMNMATMYAWNEWGEGGSIEPNTLFGYGYIDAMQETFNLNNTNYKVATNGINDIAPDVRVDVEPEFSEVAEGQKVVLKVRVKNYSKRSVKGILSLSQPAKNAEDIEQVEWVTESSSQKAFKLASGAASEAEFVIPVGEGDDFSRHNFVVTAKYGEIQNISTFVVKVPPFYGCLEKDKVKKYTDYKFGLNVKVRNYTMKAKDVDYTLGLPEGWTADKLTGTMNTAGYSGTGMHIDRTITDAVIISHPSTTVPGNYTIKLTTSDGVRAMENSLTVNIPEAFNLLYNGSFEIDEDTDGMPDVWSGVGSANIMVQTGTKLEPAPMGNKFVKVVGTKDGSGSDIGIKQEGTKGDVNWLRIDPNKKYQVSFWAKVESGKFSVIDTEAQGDYTWIGWNSFKEITAEENGNVWKPYTLEFSPNEKAGRESLRFLVSADSGVATTFYLDAVMLREIVPVKPAWYQNFETGSGFTAGTNASVEIDRSSASIGGIESVKLTTSVSGDPGSFAQCVNVVPSDVTSFDASSYSYLNFHVKDTQGSNTVKLTFVDTNNAEYSIWADQKRSVKDQWTQIKFPLSSVTGIDKTAIKEIRVGEWNPGVYYFDDFYFSDSTFVIPEFEVDKTALLEAMDNATTLIESKIVGTAVGNVPQTAKDTFQSAITAATAVKADTEATKVDVDAQIAALATASTNFNNAVIEAPPVDKTALLAAIDNAITLIESKEVGKAVGNVPQTAKDTFQSAITAATAVNADTEATKADVDAQVLELATASTNFNNAVKVPSNGEVKGKMKKIKAELDGLVKAGFITQTQEDAILKYVTAKSNKSVLKSGLDCLVKEGIITKAQEEAIFKLVISNNDTKSKN
jgi:hypothetical protein